MRGPTRSARQNTPAPGRLPHRSAGGRDNTQYPPMKGTLVNGILSSAVKVAGSLAVIGGAVGGRRRARRRRTAPPALRGSRPPAPITIAPVALAETGATPGVSAGVVYPGLTTGGIFDRASSDAAYSQVGSPKVYFTTQPVDQLNASLLSSSCRSGTILGTFGTTTIQAGSIIAPSVPFFSPIPLPRNPAPNTQLNNPQLTHAGVAVTLNKQVRHGRRPHGDRHLHLNWLAEPLARGQHLRHGDRAEEMNWSCHTVIGRADHRIMAAVTPLTGTAAGKPANGHRNTGGQSLGGASSRVRPGHQG